jgi:hypothetical protein
MKPLLFIYQPKTIAIAIAFPVDVLVLISVITLVPPTTTLDAVIIPATIPEELNVSPVPTLITLDAVIIPTLKFAGGEILVVNPARLDALDILFYFLVIYI